MEAAHLLPAADVLRRFSVTAEGGLSPAQVTSARERYGPNGERAGRAGPGQRGRARLSVSPQARGRGAVLLPPPASTPSSRPPRAGRKRGLRKPLQMILGHPAGLRGHLRRGWVGSGFGDPTPGSGSPFPFLQAGGPAFPCFPLPSRPHPLLQALAHRRSALDPRASLRPAGTVQVHILRSAGDGLARDSEASFSAGP